MKFNFSIRSVFISLVALLAFLQFSLAANAQLLVQIDSPSLTGLPGSNLSFTGTLTNIGIEELFLNGFDYDFGGAGSFFVGDIGGSVPLSILSGNSFTGSLFTFQIVSGTPDNVYNVGVTLSGGPDDLASNLLGTTNLQVNVRTAIPSAAPEPGTLALMTLALVVVVGVSFRHR